jgi:hypothetical protein
LTRGTGVSRKNKTKLPEKELHEIKNKIRALTEEFRSLYSGNLDDEAVSLLLTELQKLST